MVTDIFQLGSLPYLPPYPPSIHHQKKERRGPPLDPFIVRTPIFRSHRGPGHPSHPIRELLRLYSPRAHARVAYPKSRKYHGKIR